LIAKAPILSNIPWTTPTRVRTTVFVRDRAKTMALEPGK
jgi:hypothetical protein